MHKFSQLSTIAHRAMLNAKWRWALLLAIMVGGIFILVNQGVLSLSFKDYISKDCLVCRQQTSPYTMITTIHHSYDDQEQLKPKKPIQGTQSVVNDSASTMETFGNAGHESELEIPIKSSKYVTEEPKDPVTTNTDENIQESLVTDKNSTNTQTDSQGVEAVPIGFKTDMIGDSSIGVPLTSTDNRNQEMFSQKMQSIDFLDKTWSPPRTYDERFDAILGKA